MLTIGIAHKNNNKKNNIILAIKYVNIYQKKIQTFNDIITVLIVMLFNLFIINCRFKLRQLKLFVKIQKISILILELSLKIYNITKNKLNNFLMIINIHYQQKKALLLKQQEIAKLDKHLQQLQYQQAQMKIIGLIPINVIK